MTPTQVADILEMYAAKVVSIPGISRTNPHAFVEAKSELAGAMRADAKRLRVPDAPRVDRGIIRAGMRIVGKREVLVEIRRKAG